MHVAKAISSIFYTTYNLLAIQVTDQSFKLTIYNIYSDCNNLDAINLLGSHLSSLLRGPGAAGTTYRLWCSDFNRHHPMWDDDRNGHLFTSRALEDALKLLTLVADTRKYEKLTGHFNPVKILNIQKHLQSTNILYN